VHGRRPRTRSAPREVGRDEEEPKVKKARASTAKGRGASATACCVTTAFASVDAMDLTNSYRDILKVTVSAPRKGSVVLTGSGAVQVSSASGTPSAWVNLSIGPVSGASNNGNETSVELTSVPAGGGAIVQPFSLTTVFPVGAGRHSFFMVGIKDPNPNSWSVMFAKLTALFVQS
jgi:hypothetical protein